MIKFFRNTRKKLLSANKITKYLVYAVGEILLVVVGILIALQVNNWNHKKQEKKEEIKVLKSLLGALQINEKEFERNFQAQTKRFESIEILLFSDLSTTTVNEIDAIIDTSSDNFTFNPSLGLYKAVINTGKIALISNDRLKNKISMLGDLIEDYQENEKIVADYSRRYLYDFFIHHYTVAPEVLGDIRHRSRAEETRDKAFYIQTLKSKKVKNIYFLLMKEMVPVLAEGKNLSNHFRALIESLKREIPQTENTKFNNNGNEAT